MVSIGERKLSISCSGTPAKSTVVLLAGAGRTAADWSKTEPEIAKFTRVCSYDRAGLGQSEKTPKPQSIEEVLADLHALLATVGEHGPFLLVGHSLGGVYVRHYSTKYPGQVTGLVLVDGAHEEQLWRFREAAPATAAWQGIGEIDGFFIKPGQLLQWKTTLPMIVLSHGALRRENLPPGITEVEFQAIEKIWQDLQIDMTTRSPKGELRRATRSGHFIQLDQPEMVIQAIRDLSQSK